MKWLPFLLLSFPAFAQNLSEGLNLLSTGAVDPAVVQCTEENFQSCVHSLCGSPSQYRTNLTASDYLSHYNPTRYGKMDDIRERYRKALTERLRIEREAALEVSSDAEIEKMIAAMPSDQWNSLIDEYFKDYVDIEFEDDERPFRGKAQFDLTSIVDASSRSVVENYIAEFRRFNMKDPYYHLGTGNMGDKETSVQVTKLWSESKKLRQANPEIFRDLESKYDPIRLERELEYQDFGVELVRAVGKVRPPAHRFCSQPSCLALIKKTMKRAFERQATELSSLNVTDSRLDSCMANYVYRAVNHDNSEKMRAALPQLNAAFDQSVLAQFSEHSRETFREIRRKLKVNFPEEWNPQRLLERGESTSRNEAKDVIRKNFFESAMRGGYPVPLQNIPGCHEAFYSPLYQSDKATLSSSEDPEKKYGLYLSDFSCTYQHIGAQVYAHEMGHVLAFAYPELSSSSQAEFKKLSECVRGPTSSEDFADLISYKTDRSTTPPFGCALLKIKDGKFAPEFDGKTGDPHSSGIVRLLREAVHKDIRLNASCQSLLEGLSSTRRLTRCF